MRNADRLFLLDPVTSAVDQDQQRRLRLAAGGQVAQPLLDQRPPGSPVVSAPVV